MRTAWQMDNEPEDQRDGHAGSCNAADRHGHDVCSHPIRHAVDRTCGEATKNKGPSYRDANSRSLRQRRH